MPAFIFPRLFLALHRVGLVLVVSLSAAERNAEKLWPFDFLAFCITNLLNSAAESGAVQANAVPNSSIKHVVFGGNPLVPVASVLAQPIAAMLVALRFAFRSHWAVPR